LRSEASMTPLQDLPPVSTALYSNNDNSLHLQSC
jgi:hypothetical protein